MLERVIRWMRGRSGVDEYSRFLAGAGVAAALINVFWLHRPMLNIVVAGTFGYAYYRIFSKDIAARRAENMRYLRKRALILSAPRKLKRRVFGDSGYRYFACEACRRELRVPKNKGKLKVKCPHCGHETIKRT